MNAPFEISALLHQHEKELAKVGVAVLNGNTEKVAGALVALTTAVASGSPALGLFANAAVRKAFVAPATRRLLAEVVKYDKEKAREAFINDISTEVESLIAQALVQVVRTQHKMKDEVLEQLGGLAAAFDDFRNEFAAGLTAADIATLSVELLEVSGGIGVRVSASAKSRMHIAHAKVTGGVGFVLD